MHTQTHKIKHAPTRTHTHTHAHTRTHKHTHAHTHTGQRALEAQKSAMIDKEKIQRQTDDAEVRPYVCKLMCTCVVCWCELFKVWFARVLNGWSACFLFWIICIHTRPEVCWCISQWRCEKCWWWKERLSIKWAISMSMHISVGMSESDLAPTPRPHSPVHTPPLFFVRM